MERLSYVLFAIMSWLTLCTAQQDTLIYDPASGNYIIRYVGESDSLVTVVFEPRNKIDPQVFCAVTYDDTFNRFLYQYGIKNGANSRQNLGLFILEFGEEVIDRTMNGWFSGQQRRLEGGMKVDGFGSVTRVLSQHSLQLVLRLRAQVCPES